MSIAREPDTLPLNQGHWVIDPAHSSTSFSVRHLGLSKVRGRFAAFEADLRVGTSAATSSLTASIDLASVDTGNADRDAHLRGADFFNVEGGASLQFASRSISGAGDRWRSLGTVTLNGTTRDFDLDVEHFGVEDFYGTPHAGFAASGELRRSDYGISFGLGPETAEKLVVADVVHFELDLQFIPAGD